MKSLFYSLMICLCHGTGGFAAVPVTLDQSQVVTYARDHLPTCGTMKKNSEGLIYLKVSDRYIDDLYPVLQASLPPDEAERLCKPVYTLGVDVGAHISVIYSDELPRRTSTFPERGRKECFTLSSLAYVDPEQGPYERVYYIRVISGDLSKIRQNYYLPPQYKHRDFHITIGVIYRQDM